METGKQQLELLLAATTNEADIKSATAALKSAENLPGFAECLLTICIDNEDHGRRMAAATYLKNFLKSNWTTGQKISQDERLKLRAQLLEVLLGVDAAILNLLTEAFRVIACHDLVGEVNEWQELIPALQCALQSSDLLGGSALCRSKTLNVLLAVKSITKPFQYFLDPSVAREPVPVLLELICKDLLLPLHGLFHHLIRQAIDSKERGYSQHDSVLLVLLKTFHLAVRSHMPSSLLPCLGKWIQDILVLIDMVELNQSLDGSEHTPRLKAWKRAFQICCTLITRHRKHVDKFLPLFSEAALKVVRQSTTLKEVPASQERLLSLAIDLISTVLETGPGWRFLAPHFISLLESVIFPALCLKEKDVVEWSSDEDEYMRKNLPSDLDESSGWRDDLITPRRSALNLLGLVATSKGPPGAATAGKAKKRKKGGKGGKGKDATSGELLVIPYLSRYALPSTDPTTEAAVNYYGVLLAYGSLQEFLKSQSGEYIGMLLTKRVLPLYDMSAPSPYILSNANWLLGELACCLPETLNKAVYECLMKALVAPNTATLSWKPVRASAAGALSALLEEEYEPPKWLPLLQAIVSSVRMEGEEANLPLQLLVTAAEIGEEDVAPHVPGILTAVKEHVSKYIPPLPQPWPQVVESGFTAIAALLETLDDEDKAFKKNSSALLQTSADFLQRAWFPDHQEVDGGSEPPPDSCLSDASVVVGFVLRHATDGRHVANLKVEKILEIWANLISDWSAWDDEEEDVPVFNAIEEAVELHGRCPLEGFAVARAPRQKCILEGMGSFLSLAMEFAYAAATWRACTLSHSLLHSTALCFEGEGMADYLVRGFTTSAVKRLQELSSFTAPLAKPLIFVIATCYVGSPHIVGDIIPLPFFLQWALALSSLPSSLSVLSHLKLSVVTLVKLVQHFSETDLVSDQSRTEVAARCFQATLEAMLQMKKVQESPAADEEDDDEDDDDDDGGSEADDDEDDDDDDDDDEDDDSEASEVEETEDQFLERYAETARELEDEAAEDAEGGQDEDGHELELGVVALTDEEKIVMSCIESAHLLTPLVDVELVRSFVNKFPKFCTCFGLP